MGIARKIQNKNKKAEVARVKSVAKGVIKEAKIRNLLDNQAYKVLVHNRSRVGNFLNSYLAVKISYVMAETFGWGGKRIKDMASRLQYYYYLLNNTSAEKPHPFWVEAADFRWSLKDETDFVYTERERKGMPTSTELKDWIEYKIHNSYAQVSDDIETTWLWYLHADMGFGKARLTKAMEALDKMANISPGDFENAMIRLEKYFRLDKTRNLMDELKAPDGTHPCEALWIDKDIA